MSPLRALVLIALLPLAAASARAADDPIATTPEGPLARAAFGEWLVATLGVEYVEDWVAEQRLLAEAAARGLLPSDEVVRAAFDEEEAVKVREFHKGERARYEAELRGRGFSPERWARRRIAQIRIEQTYLALARADRVVTDADVEQEFRQQYGEDAERTDVEILFFSAFRDQREGQRPDIAKGKQEAEARAQAARAAVAGGASMRAQAEHSDPLNWPFLVDGVLVEGFRERMIGRDLDHAVMALDEAGEISPLVEAWDGYFLVRLVARTPVVLEDVRDELVAVLAERRPTSGEVLAVRARLLAADGVEIHILDR